MARRKKLNLEMARKDPIGVLENIILPKALVELEQIIGGMGVGRSHRQWVRQMSIKRTAIATAINGYVALKTLGIQNQNADTLQQILDKIKERELTQSDRRKLESLRPGRDGVLTPIVEESDAA